MKLLLDTQAVVWWLNANRKLGAKARRAIEVDAAAVSVSAASVWEIGIKAALGQLSFDGPLTALVSRALEYARFQPLSITVAHALAAAALPPHHRDPFDRMLIAQARLSDLTLVTSDTAFDDYDVRLLDARV